MVVLIENRKNYWDSVAESENITLQYQEEKREKEGQETLENKKRAEASCREGGSQVVNQQRVQNEERLIITMFRSHKHKPEKLESGGKGGKHIYIHIVLFVCFL